MRLLLPTLLVLAGCARSAGDGATVRLSGPGFFDSPFPSLARSVDGAPDWAGFPNPAGLSILESYLAATTDLDGAGTNAPIWIPFDGDIDLSQLPSPGATRVPGEAVNLVDVDPASPERGALVPVRFEWFPTASSFQPGRILAITPVLGFPLRPATTYAVVLRSPLVAPPDAPLPDDAVRDAIVETLARGGHPPADDAVVVPFRTQDPLGEMARLTRVLREEMAIPTPPPDLVATGLDLPNYHAWEGNVLLPVWQHGARPYRTEGGGFRTDATGNPVLARWERVRFTLTVPRDRPMPDEGWPVVLYGHGTGGDHRTMLGEDDEADALARRGIAVFGVAQPLHAERGTPDTAVDLDSFNFKNITAARCNFRQGALDTVYLAELLGRGVTLRGPSGEAVRLDPARIGYLGHSQGGLSGGLAMPWFSHRVRVSALSGAGGGLSTTLQLRKDPVDIAALIAGMLSLNEDEPVTPGHPVLGLIQTLADVTDPLNAAPTWFRRRPEGFDAARPMPTLMTEGLQDIYTPAQTAEALAAAAGLPVAGPMAYEGDASRLLGLGALPLPVEGTLAGWDGAQLTGGLLQFPDDGHFAIYWNPDARAQYADFLANGLAGTPRIDPPPETP